MPEVLTVVTPEWTLSVWTKDIEKPRQILQKTLEARNKGVPLAEIRFFPPVVLSAAGTVDNATLSPQSKKCIESPVFFENRTYEFEFVFPTPQAESRIIHNLQAIEDSFRYSRGSLRGSINFGNDVGWFRLGVAFQSGGREIEQYLAFEVLPVKMDMAGDLGLIHKIIDSDYPLWRFSFVRKTEHELSKTRKPHECFPLLWLALFKSLRDDLDKAIKLISKSPHSRLLPLERYQRPDRIKGHATPRLEEAVAEQLLSGELHRRHRVVTRRLSVDTPENRFVKMVLTRCVRELSLFTSKARLNNAAPEKERLSSDFFCELESWVKPLEQRLAHPMFREVGEFHGLAQESLVLQQRAGYAKVYRVWQELKLYLDVFGRDAAISMKSVEELYEVWCLLEIRRLLINLGFDVTPARKAVLIAKDFEKQLRHGIGTAFHLSRRDGVSIRLAHEPAFNRPGKTPSRGIYSWTTKQVPDILLEATFRDGSRIRWIFDAKYRIAVDDSTGEDQIPIDAINQMHRYRDALVHVTELNGFMRKTRPVVGAFVLFPGFFDEEGGDNPYAEAIDAVGIGGFPLLPGHKNLWLKQFLIKKFGDVSNEYKIPAPDPDQHLLHESVRISPTGLSLVRYGDLTLAASLGPVAGRDAAYVSRFMAGTARWYHLPVETADKKMAPSTIMQELRFCAVAAHYPDARQIRYLYDVVSVAPVKRCDLTVEQAGQEKPHDDSEYWLLRLGAARPLTSPLRVPPRGNLFRLTSMSDVLNAREWSAQEKRYRSFTKEGPDAG